MEILQTSREELPKVLEYVASRIDGTPVYRVLRSRSLDEFRSLGVMTPKDGDYAVGCGVFFYLDPSDAARESGEIIVVSAMEKMAESGMLDTRKRGYDADVEGEGWAKWQAILQHDTITTLSGYGEGIPVYTHRAPVTRDDILFEIHLQ